MRLLPLHLLFLTQAHKADVWSHCYVVWSAPSLLQSFSPLHATIHFSCCFCNCLVRWASWKPILKKKRIYFWLAQPSKERGLWQPPVVQLPLLQHCTFIHISSLPITSSISSTRFSNWSPVLSSCRFSLSWSSSYASPELSYSSTSNPLHLTSVKMLTCSDNLL